MAINPTKLLPPSSGALALRSKAIDIGKKKSGGLEGQVLVIKTQVIKIEKLISRGYTLKLKEQKEEKKELEKNKRSKKEEELEEKKPPKEGKGKIPSLPKLGFFDRIKNFIGKTLLAYFAVRLIDHLPKLVPFATALGNASEFLLGVGGNLLNGLVTFIDWGYKAYDATRGFLKNLGGDNFTKVFDTFNGAVGNLIETAIIAAVTLSSFGGGADVPEPKRGFDTSGRRVSTETQKRYAQRFGKNQFAKRFGKSNLINLGERGASKSVLKFVKPFTKRLPIIGALLDFGLSVALGEDPGRAAFKAIGAGLLGAVGAAVGSLVFGFGGVIGGILGSIGGDAIGGALYDVLFGGKKPQQKNQKVQKKQGGGITRGGKAQGSISRKISSKEKQRRKTRVSQKPREIEFESPGSSVGGEEKLFGIFPNPFKKVVDTFNPFKNVTDAGKNLGKTDYFGPILAITSKITLGQKPTEQDYKQVGLGINLLFSEGMSKGEIVGGVAAAYADGGFVDKKGLDALMEGGDITNWVARTFKDATETNAQKTLREIRENAGKKKEGEIPGSDPTLPVDEETPGGEMTKGQWGPLLDLIAGKESGGNYEAMYPSTTLKGATKMTISEVARRATGAVGKYQQLPQYLVGRAKAAGLNPDKDLYSPENQEKIIINVNIKGRGGERWLKGEISDEQFMQGLSQEFASLPNAQGKFYYPGQRSSMTAEKVKAALSKVKKGGYSQQEIAQASGSVSQKGLKPLPPTGTISGQNYGDSRPGGRRHAGQDYDISGNQRFYSRIGGEVVNIGYDPSGYGNYVDIYNKQLNVTERIAEGAKVLVSRGSSIKKGQPVVQGESNTGVIHYEIRKGRNTTFGFDGTIDPKKFLTSSSAFHGKSFGIVPKGGMKLTLHEGEMYKVIDKDSVNLLGYDLTKDIIDIENKSQLIGKAPSIIERLKAISGYASYEDGSQEEVIVVQNQPAKEESYQNPMVVAMGGLSGGDSYDPFEMLDRLPG